MTQFNMEATNAKDLKTNVAALNAFMAEAGLATKIPAKLPKGKMGAAFIGAVEEINDAGKLDDVPEAVYKFYTAVAMPEAGEGGDNGQQGGDAGENATATDPETGATGPVVDKPAEPAPPKQTHPNVFAGIVRDMAPGPVTREELAAAYHTAWGGSLSEIKFRVGVYLGLMEALGLAAPGAEKGTVAFTITKPGT